MAIRFGGFQDDLLSGGSSNDLIYGFFGDDFLQGMEGRDKLFGGFGDDELDGGAGRDQLFGGLGDDILMGGADNDRLWGGRGHDTAVFEGSFDDYAITMSSRFVKVEDLREGSPDGTDKLRSIEKLSFSDAEVDLALGSVTTFDEEIVSDVIFGDGNDNGGFTTAQVEDGTYAVELGLRAKLRFDENNTPQNEFNSNGDGTYAFPNEVAPGGFGFDPNSPTTPVWSFEWSINTDFTGATGDKLNDFTYLLEIDGDPSEGVDFGTLAFDPINVDFADHAIGTNATGNGNGTNAVDDTDYQNLIDTNNVAQNSWNYEFFNEGTDGLFLAQLEQFDPTDVGEYTIRLSAFDDGELVNQVEIDILVG
ncbi:MAG: hypothetical protein ROR55_24895 [Devosia sp.]